MSIFRQFAENAERYTRTIGQDPVSPSSAAIASLQQLHEPIPEEPLAAEEVLRLLDEIGSPATVWQGKTAMRISVSSWATTEKDLELSLASMIRAAKKHS